MEIVPFDTAVKILSYLSDIHFYNAETIFKKRGLDDAFVVINEIDETTNETTYIYNTGGRLKNNTPLFSLWTEK